MPRVIKVSPISRKGRKWGPDSILKACRELKKELNENNFDFNDFLEASGRNLGEIYKKINFRRIGKPVNADEVSLKNMFRNLKKGEYNSDLPKNWRDKFINNQE